MFPLRANHVFTFALFSDFAVPSALSYCFLAYVSQFPLLSYSNYSEHLVYIFLELVLDTSELILLVPTRTCCRASISLARTAPRSHQHMSFPSSLPHSSIPTLPALSRTSRIIMYVPRFPHRCAFPVLRCAFPTLPAFSVHSITSRISLTPASANIVITYSLICAFSALIFPGLLIHAFYLFSTYPHFLLIPNFSRTYPLIKYIK